MRVSLLLRCTSSACRNHMTRVTYDVKCFVTQITLPQVECLNVTTARWFHLEHGLLMSWQTSPMFGHLHPLGCCFPIKVQNACFIGHV